MTAGTDRDFIGAVMPGVADLDGAVGPAGMAGEAVAIARDISGSVAVSAVVLQFKVAGPGSVAALSEEAADVPAVARTWAAVVEVVRVQGPVEVVVAVEAAAIIIERTREPGIAGLFFRRQDDYGCAHPVSATHTIQSEGQVPTSAGVMELRQDEIVVRASAVTLL